MLATDTDATAQENTFSESIACSWVGTTGNLVVVYVDNATNGDLDWILWNGTTWAAQTDVAVSAGDALLPLAWGMASVLLLTLLALAHRRLSGERRRARPVRLQGHSVLVTDRLGPAVAGLRRPVVLVPPWVLALDHASQQLLLAHEAEHVRAHDSRLLTAGALVAALVPWNPVAWWMVRRLRLAVEQDCDRRVLAANPGVRRYADLLLVAAGTSRFPARSLAAHFGEHSTDLERRIHAMTDARLRWRTFTMTAAGTALLVAAACEAPRPDPVAPGAAGAKLEADKATAPSTPYFEYQGPERSWKPTRRRPHRRRTSSIRSRRPYPRRQDRPCRAIR